MNMNRSFVLKKEERQPEWIHFDAEGQVLGRLATKVADILRGKHKAIYTPHTDSGDYVVITNAEKVVLTGNKWEDKEYISYSGYMSGKKVQSAQEMKEKHPTWIIEKAVKGMLPKNKLSNQLIRKLKVYTGSEHPHKAQLKQA